MGEVVAFEMAFGDELLPAARVVTGERTFSSLRVSGQSECVGADVGLQVTGLSERLVTLRVRADVTPFSFLLMEDFGNGWCLITLSNRLRC